MRPSFERRPERLSGIPVAFEIFRLAVVIPSARFQENVSPGPSFTLPSLLSVHSFRMSTRRLSIQSSHAPPPIMNARRMPRTMTRVIGNTITQTTIAINHPSFPMSTSSLYVSNVREGCAASNRQNCKLHIEILQ